MTAIGKMADCAIDLIEQLVHADDLDGLALVTRMLPVTIEADKAVGSLRESTSWSATAGSTRSA